MNKLRQKIENVEKLCGTIVSLTDPAHCEILGNIGYDYIWIDMEHTYISYKEVLCHLNAARSTNTSAIVRVPQDDLTVTKKILDMGPDGIIFPMVRTLEEVNRLIGMTLYPPLGNRGFGPMRAIGYGAEDSKEYTDNKSLELCRFIQIEHIDCIESLEEIADNPYIDGFIFGPNDLSGSIGKIGCVFEAETTALLERAIKILKKKGKYIGLAGGFSPENLTYWSNFGIDMLTAGADWNFIYEQGKKTFKDLQELFFKNK